MKIIYIIRKPLVLPGLRLFATHLSTPKLERDSYSYMSRTFSLIKRGPATMSLRRARQKKKTCKNLKRSTIPILLSQVLSQ
jgi:hypothetical protein